MKMQIIATVIINPVKSVYHHLGIIVPFYFWHLIFCISGYYKNRVLPLGSTRFWYVIVCQLVSCQAILLLVNALVVSALWACLTVEWTLRTCLACLSGLCHVL